MKASYQNYTLEFKIPGGTSRGILSYKESWFIKLEHDGNQGIGECGILRGLSCDDVPEYEDVLKWTCANIHLGFELLYAKLTEFPSIQFGLEMAFLSLTKTNDYILFPSKFTRGEENIPINGLIWMGDVNFMKSQIEEKIEQGFTCIKMKIGAIDFDAEFQILKTIRKEYSIEDIELRVDANGAFDPDKAINKLKRLSELDLHSIEQPIKANLHDQMAMLCEKSPLPIALDEDLIGVFSKEEKGQLLDLIKPQFIILKPSFIGGYTGSKEWIEIADRHDVEWWITSALESNIGLNAIAQWTQTLNIKIPQGLGTGGLYTNNFLSPLQVKFGTLHYDPNKIWSVNLF